MSDDAPKTPRPLAHRPRWILVVAALVVHHLFFDPAFILSS